MNHPATELTMAVRQVCRCDRRARREMREVGRHPPWLIHKAANDVTVGTSRVSKERALRVRMVSCRLRLIGKPAIELRARLNDHGNPSPCRRPDVEDPHLTNGRCSGNECVLAIAPRKAKPVVSPWRLHTRPLQREAYARRNMKLVCHHPPRRTIRTSRSEIDALLASAMERRSEAMDPLAARSVAHDSHHIVILPRPRRMETDQRNTESDHAMTATE
jgi:hypothetical protein